jgi:hypothetical protein
MFAIAYHFYVLPRHREHFRHACQASRETLQQAQGLVSHQLNEPRSQHEAFTLLMAWNNRSSFERFIRSWVGVWMLNGMGLERDAFAAPIRTNIGEEESALHVDKHVA